MDPLNLLSKLPESPAHGGQAFPGSSYVNGALQLEVGPGPGDFLSL